MAAGSPILPVLYRWAIRLFPPSFREEDGEEMAATFNRMWSEKLGRRARIRLVLRVFCPLPWVAFQEWMEVLGFIRPRGVNAEQKRWGMSSWFGNLRLALRTLRKAPAFTLTTIVLLGLGLGSVTTIFTVVDHVVLRPLPYPSADRLIFLENGSHPGPAFREFETMNSVEMWAASLAESANLVGEGDPVRIIESQISPDFLNLFGARPALGRLLTGEDFLASNRCILSHGAWVRLFGSDPEILGRIIDVDGESLMVVGVLDDAFPVPSGDIDGGGSADLWRPLDWDTEAMNSINYYVLNVAGRMGPGVSLADVEEELGRVAERLAQRYPEDRVDERGDPLSTPPAALHEVTTRRVRAGLGLLLGAVGLLLLVACMNVAHLFLARGLGRVRDMAVRRALGAGTGTLIQQLLAESLVLGFGGGFLGLLLAFLGLRSFLSLNPTSLPRGGDVSLDVRIMAFATLLSGFTVLFFGLLPALRSVGQDLTNDLKGASRGTTSGRGLSKMRASLVVAEVALSVILVAEAGLLLRSFMRVQAQDPGVEIENLWTIPLTPSDITTPQGYVLAMNEVERALAAVPGVTSAAYSFTLPFEFFGTGSCCWMNSSVRVDGEDREGLRLLLQPVSEDYFSTLGTTLKAGRIWAEGEGSSEPWPAVLSENLAVELFGSASRAVGQIFSMSDDDQPVLVLGVAADAHQFGLERDPPTLVYLPLEKLPFPIPMAHMAVRLRGDPPADIGRTLREAVWSASPNMPVPTVQPMKALVDRSTAGRKFDGALFGSFGLLALVLAGAGLYGTLLYTVGQRRKELGIRMALGAARKRVQRQVVSQGLLLAGVGCGIGLAGAWGVGHFLESRLFELSPTDPGTLAGAVGVLLLAAAIASWLPARRASRVDPMQVLREE